ncbi:MAG: serine hydrolase domain-containing protein [Pseudomonadota bacterium]
MMRFRWAIALPVWLLLSSPGLADARLEAMLHGTPVTPALSGLQVSLMSAGQTTDSFAYGSARLGDHGTVPLRTDHKVRIASISKLVVAIGIMRLVEEGQLNLDTDASEYLGWTLRNPVFPDAAITPRQLLSHTSSIRDDSRYFIAAGEGELREFFDAASGYWDGGNHYASGSRQAPGRYFEYSNLNFGLLGELMERRSGSRFDQYMTETVLQPLGVSARFNPCEIADSQRAAAYRKRRPDGVWDPAGPWYMQVDGSSPVCFYGAASAQSAQHFLSTYTLGSNASLFSPQGGLRASADDLITILRMLFGGGMVDGQRLLNRASVDALLGAQWTINAARDNGNTSGEAEPGGPTDGLMESYGLSVHRVDLAAWGFEEGPDYLVGHLGEAYGVLSHALYDPATGDGIATIITGTADDPARSPSGHSPLYRVEEEILRWWLTR